MTSPSSSRGMQDNGAGAPIHFATTYKQLDMVRCGWRGLGQGLRRAAGAQAGLLRQPVVPVLHGNLTWAFPSPSCLTAARF